MGRGFGEHIVAVAGCFLQGVFALQGKLRILATDIHGVSDFVVVSDLFTAKSFQVCHAVHTYRIHGPLDAFAGDRLFALVIGGAVHVDIAGLALQGRRADPVHCPVLVGIELVVRDVHQDIRGLLPDGDLFIIISQTICLKTILSNIGNSIYGLAKCRNIHLGEIHNFGAIFDLFYHFTQRPAILIHTVSLVNAGNLQKRIDTSICHRHICTVYI